MNLGNQQLDEVDSLAILWYLRFQHTYLHTYMVLTYLKKLLLDTASSNPWKRKPDISCRPGTGSPSQTTEPAVSPSVLAHWHETCRAFVGGKRGEEKKKERSNLRNFSFKIFPLFFLLFASW